MRFGRLNKGRWTNSQQTYRILLKDIIIKRSSTVRGSNQVMKISQELDVLLFLTYDFESRLTQVSRTPGTHNYTYNGLDTRVSKNALGQTTLFLRDGAYVTDPVIADSLATYTPGVSERRGGTTRYTHSGLKNTGAQSTSSIVATRVYDAYGMVRSTTGTWSGTFGYAGGFGYQEDETGLRLLGHRYYDASTGRFLTRDPIKDGRNWYSYAVGDPINGADPDGLKIRLVGFTPEQKKKVKKHLDELKRNPATKQMMYELINDKEDHIISPSNGPADPHFNPNNGRVRYDPNESLTLPTQGQKKGPLKTPPLIILGHELGHAYGKDDPLPGAKPKRGDNVHDVENPLRKSKRSPLRERY